MKFSRVSEDKYIVEAVVRALDILEAFHDSEELPLSEISKRAGMNKSRTFRLLYSLCDRGYVERASDGKRYKLGLKLYEHASHLRRDLKQIARPYMHRLHDLFNETVNLGVLHKNEVLYIDLLESSRPFRMAAMVGSHMPVTTTALGRALVAHAEEHELKLFLAELSAAASRKLKKDIDMVRRRGYAIDEEENEPGIACIGAPILDASGTAVAAISVSGAAGRILKQEKHIGTALISMCKEISRQVGFAASWANGVQTLAASSSGNA